MIEGKYSGPLGVAKRLAQPWKNLRTDDRKLARTDEIIFGQEVVSNTNQLEVDKGNSSNLRFHCQHSATRDVNVDG